MKKLFSLLVMALLVISVIPMVTGVSIGNSITPDINTEDFAPRVWMCDNRVVLDDGVEWGRISQDGQGMMERNKNYAFEGEQIVWDVLVMDKNGVEKIKDVFATIGDFQGEGNDIEVNCKIWESGPNEILDSCNAKILEEELEEFNDEIMEYYKCTFTVETPESMYGEYWITVEATDLDDLSGTMDENEYWFLNPEISLSLEGYMEFENVRPGATSYSDTLLVGNYADEGSGVMLDMFISGTDFYDSSSSGAMCPITNQLALDNFRYFATNGAFSTAQDMKEDTGFQGTYDVATDRDKDVEGYVNIQYGDHWDRSMYEEAEIIQANPKTDAGGGPKYYGANILSPGSEMALTFKLDLPEPCNGDFDSGSINFWGEAI